MKYSKPNFEHEWSEALRYREFEKMGKDGKYEYERQFFKKTKKMYEDLIT